MRAHKYAGGLTLLTPTPHFHAQGGGYSQQTAAQAQAQSESLRAFWAQQMREVQAVGTDPAEFKNHQLPLARIKKARGEGRGGDERGRKAGELSSQHTSRPP